MSFILANNRLHVLVLTRLPSSLFRTFIFFFFFLAVLLRRHYYSYFAASAALQMAPTIAFFQYIRSLANWRACRRSAVVLVGWSGKVRSHSSTRLMSLDNVLTSVSLGVPRKLSILMFHSKISLLLMLDLLHLISVHIQRAANEILWSLMTMVLHDIVRTELCSRFCWDSFFELFS